MTLRFAFVRGAEEIGKDPVLKSNEVGEGRLHSMHEYVAPGLAKLSKDGKNLSQRWRDREVANKYDYYAAYLVDENGKVASIITGIT